MVRCSVTPLSFLCPHLVKTCGASGSRGSNDQLSLLMRTTSGSFVTLFYGDQFFFKRQQWPDRFLWEELILCPVGLDCLWEGQDAVRCLFQPVATVNINVSTATIPPIVGSTCNRTSQCLRNQPYETHSCWSQNQNVTSQQCGPIRTRERRLL